MSRISDTAHSILTLLNNINDLIVRSSDRQNAKEVIEALRIYAKGKKYPLPQDSIDNFLAVLTDARPYTLTMIIRDIADDVLAVEAKQRQKENKFKKT